MAKRDERTAKDEYEYDEGLRREAKLTDEIIKELQDERDTFRGNQATLLKLNIDLSEQLIAALQALNVYRRGLLERTNEMCASRSHCASNCRKHEWRDSDGWHRTDEGK